MKTLVIERAAGEVENTDFFNSLPEDVLGSNSETTVKGSQFKQPLIEFSGACAGCGETPYVKLITQLFGDRMMIANATGCSSIWGGTFPTIPYCKNKDGHGPTWANSLFEDNAEYGFGMRLAVKANRYQLKNSVQLLLDTGTDAKLTELLNIALDNWDSTDKEAKENSKNIQDILPEVLEKADNRTVNHIRKIIELKSYFINKSVWAFGGDGWAYDIGYGGLDHVMATGRNMNILVLDTEVYSNTGGQASKATPLGSVAKFAESGKNTVKKDMGMMLMTYGYVYIASISMGANKNQALKAIREAEAYNGPSIIMAYAPCINHGFNMAYTQKEEKKAVDSGYWLLYRYNPDLEKEGKNPLILDSKEPTIPVTDFLKGERRYTSLERTFPEKVKNFRSRFTDYAKKRYELYSSMADK